MSKILFLGDSITQGSYSVNPNNPREVYTGLTEAQKFSTLIGQGRGFLEIVNAGVSGDNVSRLEARLQADALAYNPDLVVIMIGTNDVGNGSAPITPVSVFREKLLGIVQALRSNGANIIIMTPPLYMGSNAGSNFPPFLRAMAEIAAQNGAGLIDIYGMWASYLYMAMLTRPWYDAYYQYPDVVVHPSAQGHRFIADCALGAQFDALFSGTPAAASTPTVLDYPAKLGRAVEAWARNNV